MLQLNSGALQLTSGVVVFVVTAVVFWYCLPRGGKMNRFVNTEWEPYVGVAFCSAVALGLTLMLAGVISLASAQ
jgi:hypothetical protein